MTKLLFVLPARGGGGGANSVAQETMALSRLGIGCTIAVDGKNLASFKESYPDIAAAGVETRGYDDAVSLAPLLAAADIAVATTNASVYDVRDGRERLRPNQQKALKVAYYVQDYEPLFYPPHSDLWQKAYDSYTLLKNVLLFAKTDWLRQIVYENHGVKVLKVSPSIDHEIYFPDLARQAKTPSIVAMIRPKTPRRAPARTARVLRSLVASAFARTATFQAFGATDEELQAAGLRLPGEIVNHGPLKRTEVPKILRGADLFLDLSDYQAFGRTGLEAMASGCVPIVPLLGGSAEYAVHGKNAFVVDTRSDSAILKAAETYLGLPDPARATMRQAALETAAEFSSLKAALSELRLFEAFAAA